MAAPPFPAFYLKYKNVSRTFCGRGFAVLVACLAENAHSGGGGASRIPEPRRRTLLEATLPRTPAPGLSGPADVSCTSHRPCGARACESLFPFTEEDLVAHPLQHFSTTQLVLNSGKPNTPCATVNSQIDFFSFHLVLSRGQVIGKQEHPETVSQEVMH